MLVLDPRNGDDVSDLYVADARRRTVDRVRLNYVPEFTYDPATDQILVVETELGRVGQATRCWLKTYDAENFELMQQVETPLRPMYAGFPNRSTRVTASRSGRYVYFQELQQHPDRWDVYRIRAGRFDRRTGCVEQGAAVIDSCIMDFGPYGETDEHLFFHLCCEAPNTVAFLRFDRPNIEAVRMSPGPSRTWSSDETCGSWLDGMSQALYCTNRAGVIHRVTRAGAALFCEMPIEQPRSVPLQHVQGGGGRLFVGVARNDTERSLSLASEIWVLSLEDAAVMSVLQLKQPVINFVVDERGRMLYGVNPYERAVQVLELASARLLDWIAPIGITPCEVKLIP
jgi:hypothetical protein